MRRSTGRKRDRELEPGEVRIQAPGSIEGDLIASGIGTSGCGGVDGGIGLRFEDWTASFVVSLEELEALCRLARKNRSER